MDSPKEINSVFWDSKKKSWEYKIVTVDEYQGWTECQYCNKPMSQYIKSKGEFTYRILVNSTLIVEM